jgi:hypothetical protein
MTARTQLRLLAAERVTKQRAEIPLDSLTGLGHTPPTATMADKVAELGVLEPIIVCPDTDQGRYRVIEGRRRARSAKHARDADPAAPDTIDAVILTLNGATGRTAEATLALMLNNVRSASPATELRAIETILKTARDDGHEITDTDIARETGMPVGRIRKRLRLRALRPELRAAFDAAKIGVTVAEKAARLPDRQQHELATLLDAHGHVTARGVRELASARAQHASGGLPDDLFDSQPQRAWPATVAGHLAAAVAAPPPDAPQPLLDALHAAQAAVPA